MARPPSRRAALALAGLGLAFAPGLRAQDASPPCAEPATQHWQPVVPGVRGIWVWPGAAEDIGPGNRGQVASQILIGHGGTATLVDPGPGLTHATAVRRAARCELGLAISRVLDSHAHAENVLGNAAFRPAEGTPRVRIEATPATRAAMAERCEKCVAAIAQATALPELADTPIVLPEPGLRDGQSWDSDAGAWQVLTFESAHSESDLALWNERHRVLLAPGLIYQDRLPELGQGSLRGWTAALRTLHRRRPAWVVGNRPMARQDGPPDDGLGATYRYLCDLTQSVVQALESGQSASEARPAPLPAHADWARWAGYAERHGFNVQRAWRELEPLWIRNVALACPPLD